MDRLSRSYALRGCAVMATALAITFAASTESASGRDGARQVISFTFDQERPGAPSGVRLTIDYVNPSDPNAKPYAVESLVESLANGARFDTSVPVRCRASDAELMSQGPAACPAGSRVGGGELDLDTGIEGPSRIVHNRVTLFNNENELILLATQDGGSHVVARSRIEEGTVYVGAPPLPGGPPDGFTAIKRVDVVLDRISIGGRNYVTTPPTCPAGGGWESMIQFTYRDGVSQTATSSSPCLTPRVDRTPPRIRISHVPRHCVSRSLVARVVIREASNLRAVVRLNGQVVRRSTARRFRIRLGTRKLRPGRHRLSVAARDRGGNRARRSIAFRRCRS